MTPMEFEKTAIADEEVEKLRKAFEAIDADGNNVITVQEIAPIVHLLQQNPSSTELHDVSKDVDVDLARPINFDEFKALMVPKLEERQSSLELAFSVFDEDGNNQITAMELRSVMSKFGLTDKELNEMLKEVDLDGDGSINFDEFCCLIPDDSQLKTAYKDSSIQPSSPLKTTVTSNYTAATTTTESTRQEAAIDIAAKVAQIEELVQHPQPQSENRGGTSRLQMQIGLFRLIQGAAYRCFRKTLSANHLTHLCVKDMPYRITDFVQFVEQAIELYKGLGVVEEACYPVLDAVLESITSEYARLEERIKNWKTVEKTPEMLAEEKAMLEARSKLANVKEKFAAGVEFALTMKKQSLSLADLVEGVLAINELNRLRELELNQEAAQSAAQLQKTSHEYLNKWNRVILSNALEEVDGAMIPVAYWYEDFMPKLLAAFSVGTKADIESNTVPDDVTLDKWYESTKESGEFDRYGRDVAEGFLHCTPKQKLMLKQAWCLTRHFLNGVQKRRERLECGRESGPLSQYVAFIDIYVGRKDMNNEQMRVSYPYYIGPVVWRFFHTCAEIVCTKTPEQQTALVGVFKNFFKLFANMYPCPYCRHHLNTHVVHNKEVDMYPVEYFVLGYDPRLTNFEVSLDDKLSTVVDGPSLRLFFWKLHNAVSASISRSEEWYHKDEKAFYTTRYWPSVDSSLARAKALKHSITTDLIYRTHNILKPMALLARVKTKLPTLLAGDGKGIKEACMVAQNHIEDLEEAVISGQFLQEAYHFDPDIVDKTPHFTREEEEFARSGIFIET